VARRLRRGGWRERPAEPQCANRRFAGNRSARPVAISHAELVRRNLAVIPILGLEHVPIE